MEECELELACALNMFMMFFILFDFAVSVAGCGGAFARRGGDVDADVDEEGSADGDAMGIEKETGTQQWRMEGGNTAALLVKKKNVSRRRNAVRGKAWLSCK